MNHGLRKRVALYYSISAALLFGVMLALLYLVVQRNVIRHLDQDLDAEAREVIEGIAVSDTGIVVTNEREWTEPEHWHVDVNPRFLQVVDRHGRVIRKSRNLRDLSLMPTGGTGDDLHYNTIVSDAPVRQHQSRLHDGTGRLAGWLLVATPREEAENTLADLRTVLLASFPAAVLVLFLVGRFIAIRSMAPVERLITAAQTITPDRLDSRIALPAQRDELRHLTITINQLLDRVEDAVARERQFTADASHELRTPLAVLKGTMEVMLRKPRTTEQYEEKLRMLVGEVDRLGDMVDRLLLLARLEEGAVRSMRRPIALHAVLTDVLRRCDPLLSARGITVERRVDETLHVFADAVMLDTMIGNVLTNAVKFSPDHGAITIRCEDDPAGATLHITDHGAGIAARDLPHIFDRFYRSDDARTPTTQGSGLGLTIVRRLAEAQALDVHARSVEGEGTTVSIHFPHSQHAGS